MKHFAPLSASSILCLILMFFSLPSFAQMMTGGPDNLPGEVTSGAINEGSVSGEVNVFNGTYDLSQTLGRVEGVGGLNFTLTASYSSTVTTGTMAPNFKGGTLGEGWSLNLPVITCEVEDYEKYSVAQQQDFSLPSMVNKRMLFLSNEVSVQKANYFLNVNYSVPGVGGGRLVYKYSIGNQHHFSPQKMESPIIAVLDGSKWTITAPDGNRYEFLPVPSLKKNGNLRTHKYTADPIRYGVDTLRDGNGDPIGVENVLLPYNHYTYNQGSNLKPREIVSKWLGSRITNPFIKDAIVFEYEGVGGDMDYFSVWRQKVLREQWHPTIGYPVPPKYDSDFILKEIRSSIEMLELSYEELIPPGGARNSAEDRDLFYAREVVFDSQSAANRAGWKRFLHGAMHGSNYGANGIDPSFLGSNPYQSVAGGQDVYKWESEDFNHGNIAFNHGFIETPGISIDRQGEYYELEFVISNQNRPVLFDLNVVAGPSTNEVVSLSQEEFTFSRAIPIHSTFQDPLKFYSYADPSTFALDTFRSVFLPPNLHASNELKIQVGPANADINHKADVAQVEWSSDEGFYEIPQTLQAYYYADPTSELINNPVIGTVGETTNLGFPVYPSGAMPNQFGLGLPWHSMLNFYNGEITKNFGGTAKPFISSGVFSNGFHNLNQPFWWRRANHAAGGDWANVPTAASNADLVRMRVYRYYKKVVALSGVKKYILNNLDSTSEPTIADLNNVKNEISNVNLRYELVEDDYQIAYLDGGGGSNNIDVTSASVITLLLKAVVNTPRGIALGALYSPTDYPTSFFKYDKVTVDVLQPGWRNGGNLDGSIEGLAMANAENTYVISEHSSPLGKRNVIKYLPLGDPTNGASYFNQVSSEGTIPYETVQGVKFPFRGNRVKNLVCLVDYVKHVDRTQEVYWHYSYEGFSTAAAQQKTKTSENYAGASGRFAGNFGFEIVDRSGPTESAQGNGASPKTEYKHYVSPLLFGKLKSATTTDEEGNLVSVSTQNYSTHLAFAPGYTRSLPSTTWVSDYEDYKDAGHAVPSSSVPFATYMSDAVNWLITQREDEVNNNDPNQVFNVKPYEVKVSSQMLYGPWSAVSNHTQDEEDRDYVGASQVRYNSFYAAQNTLLSESSFFIRLDSETNTSFPYCTGEVKDGITETTKYTYYSANYDGTYDGSVFEKLGSTVTNKSRLNREPSFLMASKETSNSASAITTKEEYFYYWDLKNDSRYLSGGNVARLKNGLGLLEKLTEWHRNPVRNLIYETRTTFGDGTVQSAFNIYNSDVDFVYDEYSHFQVENTLVCPTGEVETAPDDDDCVPGQSASCPNSSGCYLFYEDDVDLPFNYCRQASNPKMICPCELDEEIDPDDLPQPDGVPDVQFNGLGKGTNYKNFGFGDDLGDGPGPYNIPSPEDQNIPVLAKVYVQTKVQPTTMPGVDMSDPNSPPAFGVPVVKTYELLQRTPLNLPVLSEDVKGLKTKLTYAPVKVLHYQECVDGQYLYNRTAPFSIVRGLPVAVTVGQGLPYALTTAYEYDVFRTIKKVTDPNGIELEYTYDGYRRLIESFRNGAKIAAQEYENYANGSTNEVLPENGTIPLLNNYIKTTTFLEEGGAKNWTFKYLDAFGRPSGDQVVYEGGVGAAGGHVANAPYYDIHGRIVATLPVGNTSPFLPNTSLTSYLRNELEPAPRTSAKSTVRPGIELSTGINKHMTTCLVPLKTLKDDVEAAQNFKGVLYLPSIASVIQTITIDEDGKQYRTYSDGAGLSIATISYNDNKIYAATVNKYDGRGNLVVSVNPKEQITSYKYNYFGLPYEMTSPDAGTSKMSYDVEGKVISTENGAGKQTSFNFDAFGRQTLQFDGSIQNAFEYEGLPWLETPNPGGFFFDVANVNDAKIEKLWRYNTYLPVQDFTTDVPADFSASNTLGRIAAVFSYDDDGNPILGTTFKYDDDGFVEEEVTVFSNATDEYLNYKVSYADFLLNGTPRRVSVDVGNDGDDFTHLFGYDGLGRVTEVKLSVPEQGIFEELYAKYEYDGDNTQIAKTTYHTNGDEVQEILNGYDEANRLTSMSSLLFTETIIYEGENGDGLYNGNISKVIADYGIEPYIEEASMLAVPSTYKYTYDGLNRLTDAAATINPKIFDDFADLTGDPAEFGRVLYTYDKVGNLYNIRRGEFSAENQQIGFVESALNFPQENNKLKELTQSGLGFDQPANYEYAHNDVGYLTFDGKREQGISYTRGTYPLTAGTDTYAYDANDARIHKKGDGNEFYLRNSSGQTLAIVNLDDLTASWYAFGTNRFAEISSTVGDCGELPCRPEIPVVSGDPALFDQVVEQNILDTELNELEFPLTLFRVQLPSDKDAYLLPEELDGLAGNYNILQQILLQSGQELLFVENLTTGTQEDVTVLSFLADRLTDTYNWLVDGFHVCEEACPNEIFNCSTKITQQQEAQIAALKNQGIPATPFTLLRVRLCNGVELYLPKEGLATLPGGILVLQEVTVDFSQQTVALQTNGSASAINTLQELEGYLFLSAEDIILNSYVACTPELACTDEIPACGVGSAPDYSNLTSIFTSAAGAAAAIPYPQTIQRIRLCDGTDLHLLDYEVDQVSSGGYSILQTYTVQSATEDFTVVSSAGEEEMTLSQFLQERVDEQIFRIADFPDCGEETNDGCVVWGAEIGCDPTMAAAQMNALTSLPYYADPCGEQPAQLMLSELCNGERFYLSPAELAQMPGRILIIHEVTLPDPATSPAFYAVVNGQLRDAYSVSDVYCNRLRNFPRLELIELGGCSIIEETNEVSCTTTIAYDQISSTADPNSYRVHLTAQATVTQSCDDGSSYAETISLSNSFSLATRFNERINFHSTSEKLYIASVKVREVLTNVSLDISLNPATLLADYPNLEADLGFSVDNLYYSPDQNYNQSRTFNISVRDAIRYIISEELEGGSNNFNLSTFSGFTAGAPGAYPPHVDVNFGAYTMHAPTERGYVIDPCLGNLQVGLLLNAATTTHSVAVSMEATSDCRTAVPVSCIQNFLEGGSSKGAQKGKCYEDGKDFACTFRYCQSFSLPVCRPSSGVNFEYSLSPSVAAHFQHDLTSIVAPVNPAGETLTENCKETVTTFGLDCPTETTTVCLDGTCEIDLCHPSQFSLECSEQQAKAVRDALQVLDAAFAGADAGAVNYPLEIAMVTFCTGDIRYLLPGELASLSVSYRLNRRIVLASPTTPLRITTGTTTTPGVLADFLSARASDAETAVALRPDFTNDFPDNDPVTGASTNTNLTPVRSELSFYLHDHLGNTRVTFRADGPDAIAIDYAADYYPYGKILREYRPCEANRYLTTHHERDKATGYDNRGARLYDSEIGRFLGVDPLAGKFPAWSPYNYVLGNPMNLIDVDGKEPITPAQAINRLNRIAVSLKDNLSSMWKSGFSPDNSSAWEYGAVVTSNFKGDINIRNERTDYTEGRVNLDFSQIPRGESIVGDIHSHQYPLDVGLFYNVAQSATDIWNLDSKNEEHSSIVVAGDRLFAVVVLDKEKASAFFEKFGTKDEFQKKYDDLMAKQRENGVESFAQSVSNTVRQLLGSSSESGIGFFRTNDEEKTEFIHTNQ